MTSRENRYKTKVMPMKRILIMLDTDAKCSSFDRVVAVDAGVDELFCYSGITPDNVEPLVHGAMFTRKPSELKSTAVFVGGGNVAAGEAVFQRILRTFFGPVRVSVMMDSNGSNTTAAAAVLAVEKHLPLPEVRATVLGGTGPVGCRVAQIFASHGATVQLVSRSLDKATAACEQIFSVVKSDTPVPLTPAAATTLDQARAVCQDSNVVIAAGAAGVQFMSKADLFSLPEMRVAIDLNAVPPVGLEGIELLDKAVEKQGVTCYGAIGVGGSKMRIHYAAIQRLFEANTHVLDTSAIFELSRTLGK
jgi:methylenetetrahydrofolate/methylenetetrahydromethanopterin dehydrogenase (NADP+)